MENAREIDKVLHVRSKGVSRRQLALWLAIGLCVLAAAFYAFKAGQTPKEPLVRYKSVPAKRADLRVTVTATGQLEAVRQVDVGTEVSGTVQTVRADFNQRVKAGDVLVQLDTTRLAAQALQSDAAVKTAQAALVEAQVNGRETATQRERYESLYRESEGRQPSRAELDNVRRASERAVASEAAAKARLAEARARLSVDRNNITKATIRSPINGIVLQRKVEPGQTVAASLQTPVLFVIAESLAQMELHVAVDEADVGQVREGLHAKFSVDAYPSRTFPASISQVRYAPEPVEGVVTYETVLSVDNSDLALRPGMTATAEIIVDERKDVLVVPNEALRFAPPEAPKADSRSFIGRLIPGPPRQAKKQDKATDRQKPEQHLYVLDHGTPKKVEVTVGATDGQKTEIKSGLEVGTSIIIDVESSRAE